VEELNKYLSNLSEHHDMYVMLLCFSLAIYVADADMWFTLPGRESDLAKTADYALSYG
jgi:hypothetical protein